MREIKFRMWNPDGKKHLYDIDNVYECLKQQLSHDNSQPSRGFVIPYNHKDHGVVWEQFTGLYDKNKKPIYEGDIDVDGGVVVWNNDHSSFHIVYEGIEEQELTGADTWMEVIGNKFENPELLKPTSESDTLPK